MAAANTGLLTSALKGKKIKYEGKLTDAFYFCLGGAVGEYAGVARPVGFAARRRWCLRRLSVCCGSILQAA